MAINRGSNAIGNIKRGAATLSAVYRANLLIWPTTPPVVSKIWLAEQSSTGLYVNTGWVAEQSSTNLFL